MKKIQLGLLALMCIACNSNTIDMGDKVDLAPFKVIGISVRTTNANGQAKADMGQLWDRFYKENILTSIPNKTNGDVYSIYTEYQSNHEGAYTAIIGCKVSSLENIPEGLIGREISGGQYIKYTAKGKIPNAIIDVWQEIWKRDKVLNRHYTADFEVYGQRSQDPENAEVDVYVAAK